MRDNAGNGYDVNVHPGLFLYDDDTLFSGGMTLAYAGALVKWNAQTFKLDMIHGTSSNDLISNFRHFHVKQRTVTTLAVLG